MNYELCNMVVLALTPTERWKAAGRFGTGMTERWLILTGVAVIIVLTALLLMISLRRTTQKHKVSGQLFVDYAEKRGLSGRERQILLEIANKAGLKRSQAIFSMVGAFDHGAGKMIEESLAQQGAEESKWLRTELSFLREKLGFQKKSSVSIGPPTKLKKPSSRQIPAGKQLHITRRKSPDLGDIESTVIKNDNMELTVKLTTPVESKLGEFWRARYYFGVSVWEFDTSVVRCNGDILVLNHSDDMRFISRRRFLRVRVNKPAFIARFPFSRTLSPNSNSSNKGRAVKQGSANASDSSWGPPEFIPATVTELGGPGLLIETPLEVKAGDRVLVIVNLSETIDARPSNAGFRLKPAVGGSIPDTRRESRIVEDIGEVRHTKAIQDGFSIAVELTGLSDSNVSELIRATNAASIRTNSNRQDTPSSVNTEENVSEAASLQGI
ncbi:MAG: hypothetical protein IIC00_01885 [Planctomycetes bacterium]|nr:hypothetical protein [Planctomycetota bacterium]